MPRIIRVLSRLPTAFRMAVNMVLRREDSGLVFRLRMDVKDPRFLVVDPDDGVRHDLILFANQTWNCGIAAATGSACSATLRPQVSVRASDNRESTARPRAVALRITLGLHAILPKKSICRGVNLEPMRFLAGRLG